MNLRNVGKYNIGLDIGTGSVGWAVTDIDGKLLHFNNKPTWGSRIFPSAETAAEARTARGLRRRYERRRQRLDLLQSFFEEEMNTADPEFFIRLQQSRLLPKDRAEGHADYLYPLFNDSDFTEKDYYDRFPTIYHLRKWLMETGEKADIRLIYLAMHNIVKHRGNFLRQDNPNLSAKNANMSDSVERLVTALQSWCDQLDIPCTAEETQEELERVLSDTKATRSDLAERIVPLLGIDTADDFGKKEAKAMATAIAKACVGLSADLASVFFVFEPAPEGVKTKIYLSKDDDVEAFEEVCPESGSELFEALQLVYSSFILQELLSSAKGETISANKVADYTQYGEQLKTLKELVKQYRPEEYDAFFRGTFYKPSEHHPQKYAYDISKAQGYTLYNASHKTNYEDFKKSVEKLFKGTEAEDDPRYKQMMLDFGNEKFLRRLKTSDNGAIPFQLHKEELDAIIDNQAKFYPFLKENKDKIGSLVSFRIPYYVGPLTTKNARTDAKGENRFAWSERRPGKEHEKIYPWNWEEIIDKNASAEKFIRRMTGTCTYLQGEPVLPKSSLLYEEFCILNELNGARFTQDGDKSYRFDYQDRSDMIEELFKKRSGKISYKAISEWMSQSPRAHMHVHVSGAQGETGFESKLSSYHFFKNVMGVEEIPDTDYPMLEEIILWSTLFEDRSIFKEKLEERYSDRFTPDQIKKIVKKRFTGWGNLSKKLLAELTVETGCGPRTIIEIMREGDPNDSKTLPMVFMEIISDDKLNFADKIDEVNKSRYSTGMTLEDLPGSPAIRRSINQSLAVVEEIVKIAGHMPENVFIEVTRDEDPRKKGDRTKRRYKALDEALAALKKESPEYWNDQLSKEFKNSQSANAELTEKLTLYFMQAGKSLYSAKPLRIEDLSTYQVDHIIPQSYIKDDSYENKALVLPSENQSKSDQMLLSSDIRKNMHEYWKALHEAKLIGDKKFNNLMRDKITDKQMKGFIARQLVETSQVVKTVQLLLQEKYDGMNIVPVKAALSSQLRDQLDLVKCREINDFHHAHDALLAEEIGRFLLKRHEKMYTNPVGYSHVVRNFIKRESEMAKHGYAPGSASFLIKSFMSPGFDTETGEVIKDDWNPDAEIVKLKKYFDYRQCYISRMPEETSGAFWDETIYSPRDTGKSMTLPLKKGCDPQKYGSYSREQFAYFFIYKAVDKKDRVVLEFAPVPVRVAAACSVSKQALIEYAEQLAGESNLTFVEIVRPKLLKYQLLEFDDSRFYLTGKREVRNAIEFAFDQSETHFLKALYDDTSQTEIDGDIIDQLFKTVISSLKRYSPKLYASLDIDSWEGAFADLGFSDKTFVLKEIVAIGNGKKNMVDLTLVGKSKHSGCMMPTFNKLMAKPSGLIVIDQSVTGLFERRTRIGL